VRFPERYERKFQNNPISHGRIGWVFRESLIENRCPFPSSPRPKFFPVDVSKPVYLPHMNAIASTRTLYWILLAIGLGGLIFLSLSLGSVSIPWGQVATILLGGEAEKQVWHTIVLDFRLPKLITALLAGSSLAVSGLLMQTLFRNPLAGPFVLGISSGASLGVALLVLAGSALGASIPLWAMGKWALALAAALGAGGVLLVVLLVSFRIRESMTLLILGLMFGSATGALVSILQYFSPAENLQMYLFWTFGSLSNLGWPEIRIFTLTSLVGLTLTWILIKPLNAMLLGERYAQSMGMHVLRTRVGILVATSLLTGAVTAFCGPIAFIGIAVPHIARMVFRTADHRLLLPTSAVMGAGILLSCDLLAQVPGSSKILPINAVTSLIGAPVVIWLVIRGRNRKNPMAS
jgi:iron complex transport system permease protein